MKKILKQFIKNKKRDKKKGRSSDSSSFYKLSNTCQINKLPDIYKLFLGEKTDGFFIEFGAYDGEYVSNTSGLADLGWSGIYIEPIQEYFQKCVDRHKDNKSIVLNFAISDQDTGTVKISKGGPMSSISEKAIERFNEMEWAKGYHQGEFEEVELKSLNSILEENKAPINFDVLSIDVEGYEWSSIKTFDFKKWSPKIVIIELHDSNPNYDFEWEDAAKINDVMEKESYRIVYKDLSNTIFVKKNIKQFKFSSD
jgi:FkbM family methyltransferase